MRTSEVIKVLQDIVQKRGDRHFVVNIVVNGRPICSVPKADIVARGPTSQDSEAGTIGFDIPLNPGQAKVLL